MKQIVLLLVCVSGLNAMLEVPAPEYVPREQISYATPPVVYQPQLGAFSSPEQKPLCTHHHAGDTTINCCVFSCNGDDHSCSGDDSCYCNPALALHVLSNAGGKLGTFVGMTLDRFGELVGFSSQNKEKQKDKK